MEWERGKKRGADELAEIPFWEEGTGYKKSPQKHLGLQGEFLRV